jgi:uncharacterized protein (DUF983 family)
MNPLKTRLSDLSRTCPSCGGKVYRELAVWEIIGYFLPVHIFIAPHHRCTHCGEAFKSRPNISDLLLMFFFAAEMAIFGKLWWLSIIFLLVWLLVALMLRKEGHAATEVHTIFAGIFLATLWIIAFAARTDVFSRLTATMFPGCFILALFIGSGVYFGFFLNYLDCRFPPELTRTSETPKR